MFLIRVCCLLSGLLVVLAANAKSNSNLWQDIPDTIAARLDAPLAIKVKKSRDLLANLDGLRQLFTEGSVDLEIPLPNGQMAIYYFEYSSVTEPELARKYPDIKSFKGTDVNNNANKAVVTISPFGFRGMFLHDGRTILIDPKFRDSALVHLSYYKTDAYSHTSHDHSLSHEIINSVKRTASAKGSSDGNLRTYRIAVATTGEYTNFHTLITDSDAVKRAKVSAEIETAVARLNQVFEADLGVNLVIAANNDNLIFLNSMDDPYANNANVDVDRNQEVLDDRVFEGTSTRLMGSDNYDIGHVLGTNGGAAYIGVVCEDDFKGRGYSGVGSPQGNEFYIDYLAHEIGHQLGGDHTFNGTSGSCVGGNRNASTAYEPGSGSTIMAYAGICGDENLQGSSDAYFHAGSIAQITDYTRNSTGASCGSLTTPVNNIPDVNAGADVTIPGGTAFMLIGSATDDDIGDTLSYVWEQMDTGTSSSSAATMVDDGSRAIFRSFLPEDATDVSGSTRNNLIRYLPLLSDVIGNTTTIGESIPKVGRTLNFRLTVRDKEGGTAFDNKQVTVAQTAGPFLVTEPGLTVSWSAGSTEIVTWDVANTNVTPVSCSQVDILVSTDGGTTFNTEVELATPNDGTEEVIVPVGVSGAVRIMVKCSNNSFFAISGSDPSDSFERGASSGGGNGNSGGGGGGNAGVMMTIMLVLLALYRRKWFFI